MQVQAPTLTHQAFDDLGDYGQKRKRFAELVYVADHFETRRRAAGRVSQWRNEDDMHRLPFDHALTLIEACDGETSWLDGLNLFAAECRLKASHRKMLSVRHGDEEGRRVGC